MNTYTSLPAALTPLFVATLAFAGAGHTHNHLTVDTVSSGSGSQLVIGAGYLAGEEHYTIDGTGRLLEDGEIAVYHAEEVPNAPFDSWLAGDSLILTSDFYASTGRLDGGDFYYEISGVSSVTRGSATIAWGEFEAGDLIPEAMSSGGSRLERSFHVGFAGHPHGQGYAADQPGEYDVTLVAWDLNGVYADSDPITIRVHAIPAPSAFAMSLLGLISISRRRR